MINGKTYYRVLGLLTAAEDLVIGASYRSLSNKYHPDKWTGDKKVAHERMSEINAAYAVLGDAAERKEYDVELKRQGKYDDASDIDNDTSDFDGVYSEHSDAWDIALQFFPDLDATHKRLETINSVLSYTFKTILLESKNFSQGVELATQLESAFLKKYFGKDPSILILARYLISSKSKSAAKELNKIISVMGNSVNASQVKDILKKKYPKAFDNPNHASAELIELLKLAKTGELNNYQQQLILRMCGVRDIKRGWFFWGWDDGLKYSFTWIDGTKQNERELITFIKSHVIPLYSGL